MLAQTTEPLAVVFAVLIAFPLFWVGLIWLIGAFGWRAVAEHYPDKPSMSGQLWRWRSLQIERGAAYNNGVTIAADSSGIRFSVPIVFRPGHPPMFIPWSDLTITRDRRWYGAVVRLEARKAPRAIVLPQRLADRIAESVGAAWPGSADVETATTR